MTKVVILSLVCLIQMAVGGPPTESYKDQYCTDPRTMRKHAAYTEWADAYSCTRHRCQPGGRNLAIYTVGCKRVEAPESAIECEEVVEDTNMQFPYCCTRLRCLVVVRGEVWTRVLGQPWEALPAAPWSHMYKMKRPPPADGSFLPKTPDVGPVYELAETEKQDKVLRASDARDSTDCNEVKPAAGPAPDIVIALSTNPKEQHKGSEEGSGRLAPRYLALSAGTGHRRQHKTHVITTPATFFEEGGHESDTAIDIEEFPKAVTTEKPAPVVMRSADAEASSDEKYFANSFGITQKIKTAPKSDHWTEIPNNQWNEHDPLDADSKLAADHDQDMTWTLPDASTSKDPVKEPPPSNLQALVDAIGTRMRDIESVVQRMSDKVQDAAPQQASEEKRTNTDAEVLIKKKPLKPAPDSDQYKRFSVRNRGSKYIRTSEPTTDVPLFLEDNHMGAGYFSDASNSVLRRASPPKEPAQTYMAPVETRRKPSDSSDDEGDKKHKKHSHKKKKSKRGRKKHHSKDEKRKRFNKISSAERENIVSLEDSSVVDGQVNVTGVSRQPRALTSLDMGQAHARKIGKDLGLGCNHIVHKLLLRRYIKQFHQHATKLWRYLENPNS